jgi:hypothetical protein
MSFLRRLFNSMQVWFGLKTKPLKVLRLHELPDILDPSAVYILGEGKYLWFAAMLCPCGCGELLQMSLLPEAKPRWRLIEHKDQTISLYPSIWKKAGCHSHFFLRRGQVEWCKSKQEVYRQK